MIAQDQYIVHSQKEALLLGANLRSSGVLFPAVITEIIERNSLSALAIINILVLLVLIIGLLLVGG